LFKGLNKTKTNQIKKILLWGNPIVDAEPRIQCNEKTHLYFNNMAFFAKLNVKFVKEWSWEPFFLVK